MHQKYRNSRNNRCQGVIIRHPSIILINYYCAISVIIISIIIGEIMIGSIWIGYQEHRPDFAGSMLVFDIIVLALSVLISIIIVRIAVTYQFLLNYYNIADNILEIYNPICRIRYSIDLEKVHSITSFYVPFAPEGIGRIGHLLQTNTSSVEMSELLPIWNKIQSKLDVGIKVEEERWQNRRY